MPIGGGTPKNSQIVKALFTMPFGDLTGKERLSIFQKNGIANLGNEPRWKWQITS